ncbi:hypothetical protein PCANC_23385 [Puccinia coronata f. sp. avenae]|uniref:Uncharacterized protein n=1 Tax=Puccinia coronata f. sp. avenae TaxID=200324 RepID=A0A2N5SGS2_9BASI|nr:hypothetical protein PCANC_23385 [Puccinia coronata f. sp. avenae]
MGAWSAVAAHRDVSVSAAHRDGSISAAHQEVCWLPTQTGLSQAAHRAVSGCPPSCLGCPLKTGVSQLLLRQASQLPTETGLAAD